MKTASTPALIDKIYLKCQYALEDMNKNLKWGAILFAVFLSVGFIAIANSNRARNPVPSATPTIIDEPSKEPEVRMPDRSLTHEELLNISQNNPDNVMGKTFEMDLYLEQQPTSVSAEFITQADTNDVNTILITCNMNSGDLDKLDGASAQKAIYDKTYKTEVTFKEFNNSAGPYYKADCALK